MEPTARARYLHWTEDLVRYGDTDRQGHVNNAVFVTFLETGRVALLYDPALTLDGASFVIAKLTLEYRSEIRWPARVSIGTSIARIGRSSLSFEQALFVADGCAAISESVIVMTDPRTHKSMPIPEVVRRQLSPWCRAEAGSD